MIVQRTQSFHLGGLSLSLFPIIFDEGGGLFLSLGPVAFVIWRCWLTSKCCFFVVMFVHATRTDFSDTSQTWSRTQCSEHQDDGAHVHLFSQAVSEKNTKRRKCPVGSDQMVKCTLFVLVIFCGWSILVPVGILLFLAYGFKCLLFLFSFFTSLNHRDCSLRTRCDLGVAGLL